MTATAAQIQKIRTRMERATERARKAAEDETRAALRLIADVAEALVPNATHAVLSMSDAYENPTYSVHLLIDADALKGDFDDDHVAWRIDWSGAEDETRDLLRLVQIDHDDAAPMMDVALNDADGDAVRRGAYLSGDDPVVIPLAKLRG
jgi:hypothetical protein